MPASNASILAAATQVGTSDYQQWMTNVSQQTTRQVVDTMFDPMNRIYKNIFLDFLINRVGFTWVKKHGFENRLAVFKRSKLAYGNTVQLLAVDYIKTQEYKDHEPQPTEDGNTLFSTYKPKGKAAYVSTNQFRQYPITVNEQELRQAFADDTGLNDFVAQVMRSPFTSDNYAEYRAMANSFAAFDQANPGKVYRHKAYASEPTTEDEARDFLVDLNAYAELMYFPNDVRLFTPGDMPGSYEPNQLVLFVTPRVKAVMDVKGLATLFHVDLAQVPYRTIVVDDFGIPGCFAALGSERSMFAHDVIYENGSFYNPRTLSTNFFLTHTQIAGVLDPFEPLILFGTGKNWNATNPRTVTETAESISLSIEPKEIASGRTAQVKVTLNGSLASSDGEVPDGFEVMPDAATYTVEAKDSASNPVVLDETHTYVDPRTNKLHTQRGLGSGTVLTVHGTGTYTNPTSDTPAAAFTATDTVTIK